MPLNLVITHIKVDGFDGRALFWKWETRRAFARHKCLVWQLIAFPSRCAATNEVMRPKVPNWAKTATVPYYRQQDHTGLSGETVKCCIHNNYNLDEVLIAPVLHMPC